jgi:hypothetical protein
LVRKEIDEGWETEGDGRGRQYKCVELPGTDVPTFISIGVSLYPILILIYPDHISTGWGLAPVLMCPH